MSARGGLGECSVPAPIADPQTGGSGVNPLRWAR